MPLYLLPHQCCLGLLGAAAVVKLFNAVAEAQKGLLSEESGVPLRETKRTKEMSKDSTSRTALHRAKRKRALLCSFYDHSIGCTVASVQR